MRRYRGVRCGGTCSVLPTGVMLRCTYSLASVIAAWLDATCKPLGSGLSDEDVWRRHGVNTWAPERHRAGAARWRTLARWARSIEAWWPAAVVAGSTWRRRVGALLAPWVLAGADLGDVVERARASHVAWGAAM